MLSSSRRVKKGPGRRPLSAKRQQFMSLRGRGWGIEAQPVRSASPARRPTTGRGATRSIDADSWSASCPLERLAVRQISPRFLSQDERIELADLRYVGLSIRQIACRLGRAPSTISRELRRNATTTGVTARSTPTATRPHDEPAITGDVSKPFQRSD